MPRWYAKPREGVGLTFSLSSASWSRTIQNGMRLARYVAERIVFDLMIETVKDHIFAINASRMPVTASASS